MREVLRWACLCQFVCLSVCLCVCPLAYRINHTSKLYEIFCRPSCYSARFSSDDSEIRYVLPVFRMTSFSHSGLYGAWHGNMYTVRERRARASSHKFPTYLPGGATPSDFVVVYNDSKWALAMSSWLVACSLRYKTGGAVCSLQLPSLQRWYKHYCRFYCSRHITVNDIFLCWLVVV